MRIHICAPQDMHPYECPGPGKCMHCDRRRLETHTPSTCWLCHETLQRHPKDCVMCNKQENES